MREGVDGQEVKLAYANPLRDNICGVPAVRSAKDGAPTFVTGYEENKDGAPGEPGEVKLNGWPGLRVRKESKAKT